MCQFICSIFSTCTLRARAVTCPILKQSEIGDQNSRVTLLSSVIGICNVARSETYVTPNKPMIVCVRREKNLFLGNNTLYIKYLTLHCDALYIFRH